MAECEVCGNTIIRERKSRIDGAVFTVCDECVGLGDEVRSIRPARKAHERILEQDHVLAADFGRRIRLAREKAGLSQEELASKIGEKASVVRHVEHNNELAERTMKKIGHFLSISLYEKPEEGAFKKGSGAPALTLGDVAELKRKSVPRNL